MQRITTQALAIFIGGATTATIILFFGIFGAYAAQCHYYDSSKGVPAGFAAAFSQVGNPGNLLVSGNCNQGSISITAGNSFSSSIVYKDGYFWNGTAWTRFTFHGAPVTGSTIWQGKSDYQMTGVSDPERYVVAYVCEASGNQWKCGCRSSTQCSGSGTFYWNLQRFIMPNSPPAHCGNGSCDTGENQSNCSTDCGASYCGDGACSYGEDLTTCPADCNTPAPACGDGACNGSETTASCPADCTVAPGGTFAARQTIRIDTVPGGGTENGDELVRTMATHGDLDGDNKPDFVLVNGKRLIKAYKWDGTLLWRIRDPSGATMARAEEPTGNYHFENIAVWDFSGDGKDEVAHCWGNAGGIPYLVIRNGATGAEIDKVPVSLADLNPECSAVVFDFEGVGLRILVNTKHPDSIRANYSENNVRTVAFSFSGGQLQQEWISLTPDAGHAYFGYDPNQDGKVSYIYNGKYMINGNGNFVNGGMIAGFPMLSNLSNHADSLTVADMDPSSAGLEMVVAGHSGTLFIHKANGDLIKKFDKNVTNDPQNVMLGQFDASRPGLEAFVRLRGGNDKMIMIDADGTIYKDNLNADNPTQNINYDGNTAFDEVLGSRGNVYKGDGSRILTNAWFKNLGLFTASENGLADPLKWNPYLFAADMMGDEREEIVVWGRHVLIIGGFENGTPSIRGDKAYQMRLSGHRNQIRGVDYYDF